MFFSFRLLGLTLKGSSLTGVISLMVWLNLSNSLPIALSFRGFGVRSLPSPFLALPLKSKFSCTKPLPIIKIQPTERYTQTRVFSGALKRSTAVLRSPVWNNKLVVFYMKRKYWASWQLYLTVCYSMPPISSQNLLTGSFKKTSIMPKVPVKSC